MVHCNIKCTGTVPSTTTGCHTSSQTLQRDVTHQTRRYNTQHLLLKVYLSPKQSFVRLAWLSQQPAIIYVNGVNRLVLILQKSVCNPIFWAKSQATDECSSSWNVMLLTSRHVTSRRAFSYCHHINQYYTVHHKNQTPTCFDTGMPSSGSLLEQMKTSPTR